MTRGERSPNKEVRTEPTGTLRTSDFVIPSAFDIRPSPFTMQGHLHLTCGLDSLGRSSLRRQSFRAPMHISKPHLDGNTLVVNVINPTAGLLAGDVIRCDVHVESGARLLLTSPSANRSHRMLTGLAQVEQRFQVAAGAWLENWPELFIPQAGTRYRQETTLRVEPGGTAMLWELLAPGRVASGEAFAFAELEWTTKVFFGERLAARERYRLVPGEPSIESVRQQFPTAYYASGFIFSPTLNDASSVWREIHDLHAADTWVGCSAHVCGGWSIRVLAADSIRLRKAATRIRQMLYAALGEPAPSLRRAGF